MTACCLQTTTTIKAAELFHPSVFTPTFFSFLYYYYDFALVEQSTPWLKNHLPDLPSPDAPVGAALRQAQFPQAARTGDGQFSLLLVHGQDKWLPISRLVSVSTLAPRVPELYAERACWQPASHRRDTVVPSTEHLKELFLWSSTNFAQV